MNAKAKEKNKQQMDWEKDGESLFGVYQMTTLEYSYFKSLESKYKELLAVENWLP